MTSWTSTQLANAGLIVDIGRAMNMSLRDIQTALVAAMQESSLLNTSSGDLDSAGLFQQRPSQGWGTRQQVMDPNYSIRKFYEALSRVGNRSSIPVWQAAQQVQRSAYPSAYKKWLGDASRLLGQVSISALQSGTQTWYSSYSTGAPDVLQEPVGLTSLDGTTDTVPVPVGLSGGLPAGLGETQPVGLGAPGSESHGTTSMYSSQHPVDQLLGMEPEGIRGQIIDTAKRFLGVPYRWGGANPNSFDCSGLIFYVYNQLGIRPLINGRASKMPRVSYDQALMGQHTDIGNLLPGDLVVFGNDAHHIAIYIGNGQILEAPHAGANVRTRSLGHNEHAWGVHLDLGQ